MATTDSVDPSSMHEKLTTKTGRISEEREITEFVSGEKLAESIILHQINLAQGEIVAVGTEESPNQILKLQSYRECLLQASRKSGITGRYITDVTASNLTACKFLINQVGVKVRHIRGIKSSLIITDKEFTTDLAPPHPGSHPSKILYSNSKALLGQQRQLFEILWSTGIPAEQRIREIEEGIEPEETKILCRASEVLEVSEKLADTSKSQALVLLPTLQRIELDARLFQILIGKAEKDGVRVRVLAPFPENPEATKYFEQRYPMFEIRRIEPIQLGLLISDQNRMIFVQYSNIASRDIEKALASGIYITHKQTIASISSIYETMWADSRMREKEARSRKQAELLQDILTHDIRNYNQVARLSAELLKEELKDNVPVQSIVESMLSAVDGSTRLLERAKKLGKVLSDENPELYPVNLKDVISSSLALVKASYHDKAIQSIEKYSKHSAVVMADSLLGEVFTNIFANSIQYTEGRDVTIEVQVEPGSQIEDEEERLADAREEPRSSPSTTTSFCPYWVISISDHGKGIPDDAKPRLFNRYLENAKGSGLGMSIVHALVVERYKGSLRVLNRVPGDRTQGTKIEVHLRKA